MIAKRLKELRTIKGLTIKEVAKELNLSPSTYRDWELGTQITGEPYKKLAEIYNVSLNVLLDNDIKESDELLYQIDHVISSLFKIKQEVISLKSGNYASKL